MKSKLYENQDFRRGLINCAQLAVSAYSLSLGMKKRTADTVAVYLKELNRRNDKETLTKNTPAVAEKEKNMKHLLSAVAAVAAAGALLGAAGYVAHKYATKKKEEYDELLYTDEMGEDFILYEDEEYETTDKFAEAAADVKDTVISAAENVKETVSGAFSDVKEAIEGALEK